MSMWTELKADRYTNAGVNRPFMLTCEVCDKKYAAWQSDRPHVCKRCRPGVIDVTMDQLYPVTSCPHCGLPTRVPNHQCGWERLGE